MMTDRFADPSISISMDLDRDKVVDNRAGMFNDWFVNVLTYYDVRVHTISYQGGV